MSSDGGAGAGGAANGSGPGHAGADPGDIDLGVSAVGVDDAASGTGSHSGGGSDRDSPHALPSMGGAAGATPSSPVRQRIKSFLELDSDYIVNPDLQAGGNYEVYDRDNGIALQSKRTERFLKAPVKEIEEIPRSLSIKSLEPRKPRKLLGEFMATGICGNNISSSCLYVVALCAEPAGKYAPIALTAICGLLYLFRKIYVEVVSALPVNGGTYNLLLNTTTKGKASIAACLTMLSYVATAVISSTSAMRYVESLEPSLPVVWATVGVLSFVAILNLLGITESAGVALSIFVFHLTSLTVLIVACAIKAFSDMPTESVSGMPVLEYNWVETEPEGGALQGFYFGFSAALLGISGFESSANYVEQQAPGVFPKTLRNMWLAVTFINPLTAFLAQCLMPVQTIAAQGQSGALLSLMGSIAAGRWLEVWIILDAALVLTGAVLSSFVGFTGLVHRMTMDRCLPQVLLTTNAMRGTRHYIIMGFWTLTSLLVLFTGGNVVVMGGVYTLAFLSVMCLFVVGNALLKLRRTSLPTPQRASWKVISLAFVMMLLGLLGNVLSRDALALQAFAIFGAVFVLPVMVMINRRSLLGIAQQASAPWSRRYRADWAKVPSQTADEAEDAAAEAGETKGAAAAPEVIEATPETEGGGKLPDGVVVVATPGGTGAVLAGGAGDGSTEGGGDVRANHGLWDRVQQSVFGFVKHQIHDRSVAKLNSLSDKPLIFFTNDDDPPQLANAVAYVLQNELRRWLKFVRVYDSIEDVPLEQPETYKTLQAMHPQLKIDYVAYVGTFNPRMVKVVSHDHHVSPTFMFMSSFGPSFKYTFTEMGGLRLITA